MLEAKRLICIVCPVGCEGEISCGDDGAFKANGFGCPRGSQYAKEEFSSPKRMLTTSVKVNGASRKLLPVVSSKPIPRHLIRDCAALLSQLTLDAPVKEGQVIFWDILASGADIIAARELKAADR